MKAVNLVSTIAAGILITAGLAVFAPTNDPIAASASQSSSLAAPATPATEHHAHLMDFNDPTNLAWALGLGGTPAGAPHNVSCTRTTARVFACTGLSPDGHQETEQVTVSPNGSSWATS